MDTNDTAAPVQGEGAASPSETQPNAEAERKSQFEGVQKRIDELTAKLHESRAVSDQLAQQNQVLLQKLLEGGPPAQDVNPYESAGIDMDEAKKLKAVMSPVERQLQMMQQQMAMFQQAQMQAQFQALAEKVDPTIAADAQKLLEGWKRAGYTGWNPQDALIFAAGQKAIAAAGTSQFARDQRGRFTGPTPEGGSGAPPPPTSTPTRPANFDSLSPDAQIAWLEKNGNLNRPF